MRRTTLLLVTLVVALGAATLAACGSPDDEPIAGGQIALRNGRYCPDDGGLAAPAGANAGAKGPLGLIGCLTGTSYKVTRVETASTVGSGQVERHADGLFVIVHVIVENEKGVPALVEPDVMRVRTADGSEYTTSAAANLALADRPVLSEEIQSEVPTKVVVVYDVPEQAVPGAELVLKDFWSDMTGTVGLGL